MIEHLQFIQLNFFAIGSVIPFLFSLLIGIFLLRSKEHSRATFHLGLAMIFIACMNAGYFFSAAVYHPVAAFHRWVTVLFSLLSLSHFAQFFFYFHEPVGTRFARRLLMVQWAVALVISFWFAMFTYGRQVIFHFRVHQYDFAADDLNQGIAILINVYLAILLAAGAWRIMQIKSNDRWYALVFAASLAVVFILPAFLDPVSRIGNIERHTFQNVYNVVNIFGLFILTATYVNQSHDRFSLLGKIVGTTMVTLLVFAQVVSYFYLSHVERSSFDLSRSQVSQVIDLDYRPPGLGYLARYDDRRESLRYVLDENSVRGWPEILYKIELENTLTWLRLSLMSSQQVEQGLDDFLEKREGSFEAYSAMISFYRSKVNNKPTGKELADFIAGLSGQVSIQRQVLVEFEEKNFKENYLKYLQNNFFESISPFMNRVEKRILDSEVVEEIKAEVLSLFTRVVPPDEIIFREDNKQHFLSIRQADLKKQVVHDVGFDYGHYRASLHDESLVILVLMLGMMLVIMFGFRFFFKRIFRLPLDNLVKSAMMVSQGNLEPEIPVKAEDEIGYLTHAFNRMVKSISDMVRSKEKMDQGSQRFVPREFLQLLYGDDISSMAAGNAVSRNMTVLYSDMRQYMPFVEKMKPEEVFGFINAYLQKMVPVIHESGGFIDKLTGDSIMALFPGSVDSAIRAALAMRKQLNSINEERKADSLPLLEMGIGLHSGQVIMGTLGSLERLAVSAVGDTVNLASRVEALTKRFRVPLLISESSYALINNRADFCLRQVALVKSKGKTKGVVVYEVFDLDEPGMRKQKSESKDFLEKGIELFQSNKLKEATSYFEKCQEICPGDKLARFYLDMCASKES